jgi:hypothetical protein
MPASAYELVLAEFDAMFKAIVPLADIAMLSVPNLNIPVFGSFEKPVLGFVTLPSLKADDLAKTAPTFRFPPISTPPDTTRAPVVVLVDGVVFVSDVTVDMIVLAFPIVARKTPPVDILTLSALELYNAVFVSDTKDILGTVTFPSAKRVCFNIRICLGLAESRYIKSSVPCEYQPSILGPETGLHPIAKGTLKLLTRPLALVYQQVSGTPFHYLPPSCITASPLLPS